MTDALREAYQNLVELFHPGSMAKPTLMDALDEEYGYDEQKSKMLLFNAHQDGIIEEHPNIEGAYRVVEEHQPDTDTRSR